MNSKDRGSVSLLNEFESSKFRKFLPRGEIKLIHEDEQIPHVRWNREVGKTAVELYARGWAEQVRSGPKEKAYREALTRMRAEMEEQLAQHGYFNP